LISQHRATTAASVAGSRASSFARSRSRRRNNAASQMMPYYEDKTPRPVYKFKTA